MISFASLPPINRYESIELSRMLLARKLMPEDRRGALSPMVNSPLMQSVILGNDVSVTLAGWLPLLKQIFRDDMEDYDSDPSLSRHLNELQNEEERTRVIYQYFLPFFPKYGINTTSIDTIVASFDNQVDTSSVAMDFGPLYPATPNGNSIRLPLPFLGMIYDQILIGRHSHLHLETRRQGDTNAHASDSLISYFMDLMANTDPKLALAPFRSRNLSQRDFYKSFAYTQMMELGFSEQEIRDSMTPWNLTE